MSDAAEIAEQTVAKSTVTSTARIDWRKLLMLSLFVMVLPTGLAFLADRWVGSFPIITIAAIIICFPLATFLVVRIALQEMDRVINELTPPALEPETSPEAEAFSEAESEADADAEPDVDSAAEDNVVKP